MDLTLSAKLRLSLRDTASSSVWKFTPKYWRGSASGRNENTRW